MKIIDNKKDFYDYLSGINGIDEYVTYDRRGSANAKKELDGFLKPFCTRPDNGGYNKWYLRVIAGDSSWPFFIEREPGGNFKVEPWEGSYIADKRRNRWWEYMYDPFPTDRYHTDRHVDKNGKWIEEEIKPTVESPLLIEYMPMGAHSNWHCLKNPILSGLPIVSKIPAQDIWQAIYDFLLRRKEPEIIDTRTDEEKAESHGFDRKTSFRKDKEDDKRGKS